MSVYTVTYMHTITISRKEAMNFKERRKGYIGGLGRRKEMGKCKNIIILEKKKKVF